MKIGVLSLQGGFVEHINHIKFLGHDGIMVKSVKDLNDLDGIILPGGESTTIGKLLKITDIKEALIERIKGGLPVWGTCAGMILLAKQIEGNEEGHLKLMNIKVRRNAYGTQINSFKVKAKIQCISKESIPLVFIRAPFIIDHGNQVETILSLNNNIVAAKEKNMVVTSFHPELTENFEFHNYFIGICKEYKKYA